MDNNSSVSLYLLLEDFFPVGIPCSFVDDVLSALQRLYSLFKVVSFDNKRLSYKVLYFMTDFWRKGGTLKKKSSMIAVATKCQTAQTASSSSLDTNCHDADTRLLSQDNNATDALRTEKRNNVNLNGLWG
jgi:hypothetical protein